MNLELNSDELDLAVQVYLAFKGYISDSRIYGKRQGLDGNYVLCTNIREGYADVDRIIEMIRSR